MGGHPYWYYAKYQTDIDTTLQALRQQEFLAGRYNPAQPCITFPVERDTDAPGVQHPSIEAAMEAADADGTRSILDMFRASKISYEAALSASDTDYNPALFCTTYPVESRMLKQLFGTEKPTHQMVETVIILEQQDEVIVDEFWDSIDRGTGRHILIYENDEPSEIFFIGYSFD